MSLLRWRSKTRARLLAELNEHTGVEVSFASAAVAEAALAATSQRLEDLRLALPRDQAPRLDDAHPHRRRPLSTVYHSHPDCAAWPVEPPFVELLGAPLVGDTCRECADLWRIASAAP